MSRIQQMIGPICHKPGDAIVLDSKIWRVLEITDAGMEIVPFRNKAGDTTGSVRISREAKLPFYTGQKLEEAQ